VFALLFTLFVAASCTEATQVSYNISKEADNFNVIRRVTVINTRTDRVLLEIIAQCSVQLTDGDVDIVSEIGDGVYKKDFVRLTDNITYVVEDLCGAEVSPYTYEINYIPESLMPFNFDISR